MRRIGCLVLLLLGLGWLASEIHLASPLPPEQHDSGWRRTRDGWERMCWWNADSQGHRPALHPLVIGFVQVLASAMGLVAFSKSKGHRPAPGSKPATAPRPAHSGPRRPGGENGISG